MKLALPLTAADAFSSHYGAAAKFTVFEVDRATRRIERQVVVVPQASEPCQWPRLLRAAGVDLVLAGGMGRGARAHMAEHGVGVLAGVPEGAPDELVTAWLEGRLITGPNGCEGHATHANGHHHDDEGGCHCAH